MKRFLIKLAVRLRLYGFKCKCGKKMFRATRWNEEKRRHCIIRGFWLCPMHYVIGYSESELLDIMEGKR